MATKGVDRPQPIVHHLEELRSRLLKSVLSFLFLSIGGYYFVDPILEWMAKPVGQFIFIHPTDALFIRLKVACGIGLVLTLPVFLYQAWRFIEVALFPKEKSIVLFVVPASYVLMLLGFSVAVFGVAPLATQFLLDFGSTTLKPYISIQAYLSFLVWMIFGFGLLFQLPLLVLALSLTGVVRAKTLSRYRKHVLVTLLILAAVLTPGPDVFSQLILTIPSYFLFEISLFISKRFEKKDG